MDLGSEDAAVICPLEGNKMPAGIQHRDGQRIKPGCLGMIERPINNGTGLFQRQRHITPYFLKDFAR